MRKLEAAAQKRKGNFAEPSCEWRRWTGIEPAGRGSPVPTALKAAEPTRYSDTSLGLLRLTVVRRGAALSSVESCA